MDVRLITRFVVATVTSLFLCTNGPAVAEERQARKIFPTSARITGPNGETFFAIPYRIYTEYSSHSTKSGPGALGVIDAEVDQFTVGADFVSSSFWYFGGSLSWADTSDNGSGPFAPSLVTNKDVTGGTLYVRRPVMGPLSAGVLGYYNTADGLSIFNFADRVTDDTEQWGYGPFVNYDVYRTNQGSVSLGGALVVKHLDSDYVGNIPPTASLKNVVAQFPLVARRQIAPRLSVHGLARLNWIVSRESFDNVPKQDRTTVTIGGGAEVYLGNGFSLYGRVSHNIFDGTYDQTSATVGLSVNPRGLLGSGRGFAGGQSVK